MLSLSTYVLLSAKNEKTDAFLDRDIRIFQMTFKGSNISAKSVTIFVGFEVNPPCVLGSRISMS